MNEKNLEEYMLKLYNIYIKKDEYEKRISLLQISYIYFDNHIIKLRLRRNWKQVLKNLIQNEGREAVRRYSDLLSAISEKEVI